MRCDVPVRISWARDRIRWTQMILEGISFPLLDLYVSTSPDILKAVEIKVGEFEYATEGGLQA
jgi:hypothetical protein